MLKMLSIRLRYWHLVAFFIWLQFKFQFSAIPTVHVILALNDLGKGKIHPKQAVLLTSVLDGNGWSTPQPSCFTTGADPIPFVYEAGWAPGLVWMGVENLVSHWVSIPRLSIPWQVAVLCYTILIKTQKSKINL
jgi:hypothetical protein